MWSRARRRRSRTRSGATTSTSALRASFAAIICPSPSVIHDEALSPPRSRIAATATTGLAPMADDAPLAIGVARLAINRRTAAPPHEPTARAATPAPISPPPSAHRDRRMARPPEGS